MNVGLMPNWRNPRFDWDDGNTSHLEERHDVFPFEAEQVFYNGPIVRRVGSRYLVLGRDDTGRYLLVVCEERRGLVRVITARDMTPAERRRYERET